MKYHIFKKLDDGKAQCLLCCHFCILENGKSGKCGVRRNSDGEIVSLVSDKIAVMAVDPIEKKPLFHVLPASKSFSIAANGCNFSCQFCQNYDLSIIPKVSGSFYGERVSSDQIVSYAIENQCRSISYTYSEPTVYFELMMETALKAKEAGLLNIMVSNGFMSDTAIDYLKDVIDAANIDLKSFNDEFYKKICGGNLKSVLHSLNRMKKENIFLEVTTLLIPEYNDSESEISDIASFIITDLGKDTPWHISKFYPTYKMSDLLPESDEIVYMAVNKGFELGLDFVYSGNIMGGEYESTFCPKCKNILIERRGYCVIQNRMLDGRCPDCDHFINGIFDEKDCRTY